MMQETLPGNQRRPPGQELPSWGIKVVTQLRIDRQDRPSLVRSYFLQSLGISNKYIISFLENISINHL